jgi:hypothetical protein
MRHLARRRTCRSNAEDIRVAKRATDRSHANAAARLVVIGGDRRSLCDASVSKAAAFLV